MLKVLPLDVVNLGHIPEPCFRCLFWESGERVCRPYLEDERQILKEEWFSTTLLKWGDCGKILYDGHRPMGFAQYAPPDYFPQLGFLGAGPASRDAVVLACLSVADIPGKVRLARFLLQAIEKDLFRRGHSAIETFAVRRPEGGCGVSVDFCLDNGFRVLRENPDSPLLRMELEATAGLAVDLASVLEQFKVPVARVGLVGSPA